MIGSRVRSARSPSSTTSWQIPDSHRLRRKAAHLDQIGQLLHLLHQRRRNLRLHQLLHAGGQRFQIVGAQRPVHPPIAAEGVDRDRNVGSFHIFKQQRLSAELAAGIAIEFIVAMRRGSLADAIGNLRDLQNGRNACFDAGKFAGLIQVGDKLREGFGGHCDGSYGWMRRVTNTSHRINFQGRGRSF